MELSAARRSAITVACLALVVGTASGCRRDPQPASLTLVSFGGDAGVFASPHFLMAARLRNAGESPINIVSVRTGCGSCTTCAVGSTELLPGKETSLEVRGRISEPGPFGVSAFVQCDDPEQPALVVTWRGRHDRCATAELGWEGQPTRISYPYLTPDRLEGTSVAKSRRLSVVVTPKGGWSPHEVSAQSACFGQASVQVADRCLLLSLPNRMHEPGVYSDDLFLTLDNSVHLVIPL